MHGTAIIGMAAGALSLALAAAPAFAQQIHGTPGAPDATVTLDGRQLPPPVPEFGGVIENDALGSTPWWTPRVVPPPSLAFSPPSDEPAPPSETLSEQTGRNRAAAANSAAAGRMAVDRTG